ncbi:MAG TPA: hypothetical protein VHM29_08430 [Acidimicrobiia bacterium]|nr:hypothetical protein [Acidimicrobiia bacterium]
MAHREAEPPRVSGGELAAGIGVMFAATLMIVGGLLQIFQGISAIANDEFFVTLPNYVVTVDVSTWGWIHLVFGILVVIAGFSLFSGRRPAAIFAIVLAVLSAIANFGFIPYYPVWALFIIALDIFIVWAIARSGVLES